MVFIRVLGAFAAEVDGAAVHLGGPRQRGVLALLVAARGQVVPVDRMIEDLWRGEPPARALMSLQAYVSNLRRLLEPGRPPRTPARLLVSAAPGYALRLPPEAVDAWRFEGLLGQARTDTDLRAAQARLAEALGLWQGPAFAEVADEPWAAAETARLNELRLVATELHVAAGLRIGDPAAVVPEAERLTRDEPLREEGWRLHALALWSSGRQADALATLRRARGILAEELGLDPGPDLTALEEAILTQRTDVLRATVPPPPLTAPLPQVAPLPGAAPIVEAPFVGREAQLSALVTAATGAATDGARIALVTGEAGLGKSTLLEHLGRRLEHDGWLVAVGRCPEVDSAPPAWAWTEALRAAAATTSPGEFANDLAPLLTDTEPVNADATAGRFRLRQAVWKWLAAVATERPVAVVLDDLHWADATTLELLGGGLGVRAPILVVAAYRADESGHLTETLASLARATPLRLALPGLNDEAVAELVRAECEADEETIAGIAERTGGNPFYVRESARLLNGEGALVALSEVPEGVRDVLRRRLARLPEGGVSVLRLAAVAGRESSVDVLVKAADTDEDGVMDALDAGVIAGLLDEPGPGLIRFVHALVRDTLIADVSRLRATRMHARIAAALEGTDDIAALAHHYARAGSPKAVGYCVQAAELAEARYAHDVAADLLTDAVTNSTGPDERVELLGRLLRAQIRAGAVAAARETRREAVEYAESLGRDDLMIAAFTAWTEPTAWQARTYGTVDRPIVDRLSRLLKRDLTPSVRSRLLTAYAHELVGEDDPTVVEAAQEALDLATEPRLRAAALEILAEVHGDAELCRELVEIGTEHDLPVYRVTGLLNHAGVAAAANDPVTMHQVITEALELARTYRMREAIAVAEITLASLALIEGRFADAELLYIKADEGMRRIGSVHATGFLELALATIWLNEGTLGAHLDDVRALHAALGSMTSDLLALALHANGLDAEAREVRASPSPIRPDFFFTFLTTLRAMAIVALNDRDAAEEIYATLLPHRNGPPAGAASLSVALRPVAHTLGELAVLLGRTEAAAHFTQAATIADRWNAPHWAAEARSRTTT
ncbi:DNA-binding SARP family transcriptional activator/energy-coupling factor transporter ATP-binding protein EcfA2 [Nonomuraea muscovyensis]|uniref:DNA-binding SARP family transcriptional activator/energy-coupling factor transporter ATP-binding protein EcfA2 n=1 Tax=Nonomuraea muscovyensis TaxID=1124761 RepID=A0A7X0C3N9_9ACTN|nr:AfsR/SARP family transcriptional regulator [Nonomuraea muscovyensis]MBB6347907.1 DNA-binding SARP family transcriptional activator/energy-coupling factor transporter ATP-binding protein EcfA2 [Nonomuraea muscovyensis]